MDLYQVGAITQTHGVRGEVKVFPLTDDVMRFKKLDKVILDLGRGEGMGGQSSRAFKWKWLSEASDGRADPAGGDFGETTEKSGDLKVQGL